MIKSKGLITSSLFLALLVSILSCVQTQEVDPISPYSEPIVTDSVEQNAIASLDEEVLSTETKEEQNKALDFNQYMDAEYEASRTDENTIERDAEQEGFLIEGVQSGIVVPSEVPETRSVAPGLGSEPSEQPPENLEKSLPIQGESAVASISVSPIQISEPTIESNQQVAASRIVEPTTSESTEGTLMPISIIIFSAISILLILLLVFIDRSKKYKEQFQAAEQRISTLGIADIESAKNMLEDLQEETQAIESELIRINAHRIQLKSERGTLEQDCQKLETKINNQRIKLSRTKELYAAVEYAVERFYKTDIPDEYFRPLDDEEVADIDSIAPSVMLNLNYMNYQELRKEFRINQKQIDSLLENYAQRYTTKANQAIYKLMVISLRSELQNILYNLKHEKLDNALFQVQSLISKYLVIVSDGNQQIAGTMRKFIGELEHLFDNSVRIEYEYYIKKEQARQEQLALRQQMREEAEERKRLEEQKKQVALEEAKYQAEIAKIQDLLAQEPEDSERRADIEAKLQELNVQLDLVEEKKEEITKLQNGKAGNVYIISNLGSFGDKVFKVGMTRRLDPQERVDELGSASVPFKFDVHSFIFSEDAVGLENEMHNRLRARRLNKVNLRKEFFEVSLDELEQIVLDINPTAAFNRTMLAEDYKQSLSLGEEEIPLSNSDDTIEQSDEDDPDNGEND
ncbi:MAG: hypothetical protein A2Y31_10160 [Spirochaetes bacterium GWC2_52_13]|nr:MAG: hypothetical protein A2Y31_10160 [Spirochaetes bacterium GWC2_52_13]